MLWKSLKSPLVREVLRSGEMVKTDNALFPLYISVRHSSRRVSGSRFHQHLTYSKLGNMKPREPLVELDKMVVGKPLSASLAFDEDMVKVRKFEFDVQSMNVRGFLRFQKPYTPPADAEQMVLEVSKRVFNSSEPDQTLLRRELKDSREKYDLLTGLFERFQHAIPNSMLYMMNTIDDVVKFYITPVNTRTPYAELIRNKDNLPPNVHIQEKPLRFHPDTDTMFGGKTAFTKSSTIISGLRAKRKYRGYEAKMTWP